MMLAPVLVFFGILFFYPLGSELVSSLHQGSNPSSYVGLRNYSNALNDPTVRHSFFVTMQYAILSLAGSFVVGLLVALILNNERQRGRSLLRGIILVPYLTSVSIIGLLWRNMLDPQLGILNRVLVALGLPQQQWLNSHPLGVLIGITIWQLSGYAMVLFTAGLQGIPEQYYEAARVDGASPWRRFRSITVPLLARTTVFVTIIGLITTIQQFALPYIVTNGGPADDTDLYVFHIFQTTFRSSDFGSASALAFLLLVVVLFLTLIQLQFSRRGTK